MLTSIQITKDVKSKLNKMKNNGESYENVIIRLMKKQNNEKEEEKILKMKPRIKQLKPARLIG